MTLTHAENPAQHQTAARNWCRTLERAGPVLIEAALGWVIDSDEIITALQPASAA